jgi:LysM repeat protein
MPISHERARKLIQLSMDEILPAADQPALHAHLQDCLECQSYAHDVQEAITMLSPAMKKRWGSKPTPLSVEALRAKKEKAWTSTVLTMRTAALGVVCAAFIFSAWQFISSGPFPAGSVSSAIPQIPTPSTSSFPPTGTSVVESCEKMIYPVQAGDSLASIDRQLSVSEESIIEINDLKTEIVSPGLELLIPICSFTPTGTFHAATFTTTYTSTAEPASSTPEADIKKALHTWRASLPEHSD